MFVADLKWKWKWTSTFHSKIVTSDDYLFHKGNLPKKISINCVVGFRTGHLSNEVEECSGKPTQVTVPANIDAIHSTILDAWRVSAKKIAETLGYVQRSSRLYYSRDFRHKKALSQMGSQTSQRYSEAWSRACLTHHLERTSLQFQ
jgi:hypothetical protein